MIFSSQKNLMMSCAVHYNAIYRPFPIKSQYLRTWEVMTALGPVVRTLVSANLGLNFNPGFFFFLSKALSWIIFYINFRVSNHQIVGKEN